MLPQNASRVRFDVPDDAPTRESSPNRRTYTPSPKKMLALLLNTVIKAEAEVPNFQYFFNSTYTITNKSQTLVKLSTKIKDRLHCQNKFTYRTYLYFLDIFNQITNEANSIELINLENDNTSSDDITLYDESDSTDSTSRCCCTCWPF